MSNSIALISEYLKGNILLLCHHNADPDAVCSAYAFKKLLQRLKPEHNVDILLPGGASSLSKKLITKYEISTRDGVNLEEYEVIFLLDTASFNQLDEWEEKIKGTNKPIIVIDHHSVHPALEVKASLYIHYEKVTSTCEIISFIYEHFQETPERKVAEVLILGIAYDSKHLSLGTPTTLRTVAVLLENTESLRTLLQLLTSEPKKSEKIARLKAAQRMQIHEINGWTVVTANIGSFQASVARGFITLGADIAILAGNEKKQLKVSMRSIDKFYKETGIHLGRDISLALGYEFNGSGSGHPTAAGFNGIGTIENVLSKSIDLLKEQFEKPLHLT